MNKKKIKLNSIFKIWLFFYSYFSLCFKFLVNKEGIICGTYEDKGDLDPFPLLRVNSVMKSFLIKQNYSHGVSSASKLDYAATCFFCLSVFHEYFPPMAPPHLKR